MIERSCFLVIALFSLWLSDRPVFAAGPKPIHLWPQGAPGQKGDSAHDIPLLRVYLPESDITGTGVVILPGGGYGGLAMDHEGHQIAKWWNERGVAGFVVTYRHGPHYQHPAPLQDAQRAIRHVRAHANEFGVDPQRIGIMGFSAGGHLASTVSTHFDDGDQNSDDPVAQQSSRPDFAVLCYPVISMDEPLAHKGSRRNLLGIDPTAEQIQKLSTHLQVTEKTPPTFLFHTAQDPVVPVGNALAYYDALVQNHVDAEIHIYQKGRHGVGLAASDPVLSSWPERLWDWMKVNNFLTNEERVSLSGTVKLNSQPLGWGMISLQSRDQQTAPIVSSLISRGKFLIPKEDGPIAGRHSVSIHQLGGFAPEPTIEDARTLTGDHTQTSLVVQVQSGTENSFEFDLTVE